MQIVAVITTRALQQSQLKTKQRCVSAVILQLYKNKQIVGLLIQTNMTTPTLETNFLSKNNYLQLLYIIITQKL